MTYRSCFRVLAIGCWFALAAVKSSWASALPACPTTLAWDKSPDGSVIGYAVYWGTTNTGPINRLDAGPAQSVTFNQLYAGSNYLAFVVAYNGDGLESEPSNVIHFSPPALSKLQLTRAPNGSVLIKFRSAPGSLCRVEYSPTLPATQWQTLAVTNADAAGYVTVTDAAVGALRARFYRALRP